MKSNRSLIGMAAVAVGLIGVLAGGWWAINQNVLAPGVSYGDVEASQAQSVIEFKSDNPDFMILDVRTPEEFGAGHIDPQGAPLINLDFYGAYFKEQLSELDKSKTYLVYCRSGNRSSQTVALMKQMGFEHIYHLTNGFSSWDAADMPTVSGRGSL